MAIAYFENYPDTILNIELPTVNPRPEVEFFANDVQLNNKEEETERFIPITSEPAMPVITVANNQDQSIRVRLKIEYIKSYSGEIVRKWLNYYPAEENDEVQTQTINAKDTWNVDFGDHIRGGTATFEYVQGNDEWNEENIQTFVFYLRGQNPNRNDVISYIEDQNFDEQYWFLIRLIRHESGTGSNNIFRHYNVGGEYTITSNSGLPNLGPPRGYGLGQIDNFGRLNQSERNSLNLNELEIGQTMLDQSGRTIDRNGYLVASDGQVWNWKENIQAIITLLNDKSTELRRHIRNIRNHVNNWNTQFPNDQILIPEDQQEGNITFSWVNSEINNFDEYNDIFENDSTDTVKSFYDAILIKYYNGIGTIDAHHYMYYLIQQGQKPEILVQRSATFMFNNEQTTRYYVQYLCEEIE